MKVVPRGGAIRPVFISRSMTFSTPPQPVLSPCTGVCTMDLDGYCMGCLRTLDEIAHWSSWSNERRLQLMDEVLPAREQERYGGR